MISAKKVWISFFHSLFCLFFVVFSFLGSGINFSFKFQPDSSSYFFHSLPSILQKNKPQPSGMFLQPDCCYSVCIFFINSIRLCCLFAWWTVTMILFDELFVDSYNCYIIIQSLHGFFFQGSLKQLGSS